MAHSEQHTSTLERWIAHYARIGYAAKGVIYGSSGLLALFEAMDIGQSDVVGSEGALRAIAEQPFGKVLLVVLCISLVGYVVWRFIQAFLDPEHSSTKAADIIRRISYGCSGLVYAGLAYSAVEILTADSSEGKTAQEWAYTIMSKPFGRWVVGAGGLMFVGIGGYYFYRAIKAKFRKRFKQHEMSEAARTWATFAGRFGIAARGVVYAVIGAYATRAAWLFEPDMVKTTEDALELFDNNPTDEWILATLGVGFIAYGVHMAFQARYRSIDPL